MKPYGLAVKAVVLDAAGNTLLVRRSLGSRSFPGCWEWPGGKVDPGEDFATALVRETREETGLDIEITGLAGAVEFTMRTVKVVLLCMETRVIGGDLRLSHEHDDFVWTSLSGIGNLRLVEVARDFMLRYAGQTVGCKT